MVDISFRALDVIMITIFLFGMVAMGIYFARKTTSTEEYFLGNRAFAGWVIGISMLGTSISTATFLAFPAAAIALDWRQVVPNLMLPINATIAIILFIPLFRRGKATSAFEYLGERYGPLARLYGVISFVILQVIRIAMILYLLAIPISLLTGLPIVWIIVAVGIFVAFYTIAGGIEAVIWTDVIQTIVLLGGGLLCFVVIALKLPGGVPQIFEIGSADHKFGVGAMEWDLGRRTFFTMAVMGVFQWLHMYTNQNVVQRYLAAKSMREARKATALCAVMSVPTWVFFFFVGTCVYVFFKVFPEPAIQQLDADSIFPYFILTKIPAGLAGIVIAAVLAAAMSSLDSSINAVATVSIVDIFRPFLIRNRDDRFYLLLARIVATSVSILMICVAIIFSQSAKESMLDLNLILQSVFGGCITGFYMLGFFTKRAEYKSSIIALIFATLFNIYLMLGILNWLPESLVLGVHSYWVGTLVVIFFTVLAYFVSLVRNKPISNLYGLTVWTIEKNN